MRSLFSSIILISGLFFSQSVQAQSKLGDVLFFASIDEGRELLGREDEYTDKWSEFDIQSRLQNKKGTKEELVTLGKQQVLSWTQEEQDKISEMIKTIDLKMAEQGIVLPLPDRIPLIKSTLKEEGGAVGYTRLNYIVLRQDVIHMEDDFMIKLILHEVFHVLTRKDPIFRKNMYEIIGFTVDNPVEYPESIADLRITNPDAHASDSYISLKDQQDNDIDVIMVLYANKPYESGIFFQYLTIGFMEVTGKPSDKTAKIIDGEPVIYSIEEIEGFMDKVGMNTQYIIDPEEIMADNFAYAVMDKQGLPSEDIIKDIKSFIISD